MPKKEKKTLSFITNKRNIIIFDFYKCFILNLNNPRTMIGRGVQSNVNKLYKFKAFELHASNINNIVTRSLLSLPSLLNFGIRG
jgi:hypothetical protein